MLEMFVIQHTSIWSNFKKNKRKYNFYCVTMPMMTPQIFKYVDSTKTQKLTLFFLQIEKFINYTPRAILLQKKVL